MKFEFKEKIHHPRARVYDVLKNGLAEVVPLVPNVKSLKVIERHEIGKGETKIVNEWHGAPEGAPALIRPLIKPEMHVWRDYAHWIDAESLVHWRFEAPMFKHFYTCKGTNFVEDDGKGGAIVRLTGELLTYPEKIPGVPKMLAKKIAPTVEKWLLNLVSPNLAEMPRAVGVYLDNQEKSR